MIGYQGGWCGFGVRRSVSGAVLVLLGKGDGGRGKGGAKVAKEIGRAFTAAYGREPSITRVRPSGGARGKLVTERGARA